MQPVIRLCGPRISRTISRQRGRWHIYLYRSSQRRRVLPSTPQRSPRRTTETIRTLTISATTSGGLAVGAYKLVGRVTASGVVYTVYTGNLDVAPDPADTSYDARSHVKKTLDAINAVLESKASKDQEAWSTADGRSLSRYSYEDLLKLKDKYDDLWNREKQKIDIAAGKGASKTPRVRF